MNKYINKIIKLFGGNNNFPTITDNNVEIRTDGEDEYMIILTIGNEEKNIASYEIQNIIEINNIINKEYEYTDEYGHFYIKKITNFVPFFIYDYQEYEKVYLDNLKIHIPNLLVIYMHYYKTINTIEDLNEYKNFVNENKQILLKKIYDEHFIHN